MKTKIIITLLTLLLGISSSLAQDKAERIKVGVPTALTGDAAAFGQDIKNALVLMNEKFGNEKYDLIFEDERCTSRDAVSVARKLIDIDKVRYALGFPCNQTMLSTASIYDGAGIVVITSSATSGDVLDVGKHIFRLFPSDASGAKLLFKYIAKRHKKLAILTEQNEYPVMMERTVRRANQEAGNRLQIESYDFVSGETDLRTILLTVISKKFDAIFVNANTDESFIPVVKQLNALKYSGARYSAYLPGSAVVLKALGDGVNGFIFSNLPVADNLVTEKGRELMAEFRKRFGEPQSGFPVVPTSFEAFRVFDLMIRSGKDPLDFLSTTKFSGGFLPDWHFDQHGAVQGINFEMQKVQNGKVITLND